MFRIIRIDGTELGITNSVNYIKLSEDGCFANATSHDAIGIAFNSIAYNLIGHTDIADAETVIVSAIDGGAEVETLANTINILLGVAE